MAEMSKALRTALESDCATDLEPVMAAKKKQDFVALQTFLSPDEAIDSQYRLKALDMLGRWGDPAPAAAIRALLPRLNEIERCRAIDALGRLGSDEALAGILAHADDPSPHVRKFVARALGKSNAPAAQSKLRAIAEQEPVPYIRRIAAKQLK